MPKNSETGEPVNNEDTEGNPPTERDSSSFHNDDRSFDVPPIPSEILENLEPEQREVLLAAMFRSIEIQLPGSSLNQFLSKLEPQHITEMIAERSNRPVLIAADRKNSRLYGFLSLALLVLASLAVMLVLALINENDLLLEIVKLGGVGLGGFGGGYGFSALRRRS